MKINSESLRYSKLGEIAAHSEPVITQLMADALNNPNILSLAAGFTDNTVLPESIVQDAVTKLVEESNGKNYLQYGTNVGRSGLRKFVCELLSSYPEESDLDIADDSVLITNGSQQALYISAQLFCEPGDIVLVEKPSYFVFLELLKGLGLRPVSIPDTIDGRIDFDAFGKLLKGFEQSGDFERVKLIYLMGVFANPSSRSICEEDKIQLAHLLGDLPVSIPVIEDMAYRELYFEKPYTSRSLLALDEWKDLPFLYSGTFTKPFSTGIKVGFVTGNDRGWLDGIARIKGHQDFGTSNLLQAILEKVVLKGDYFKHLESIRGHYAAKSKVLHESLFKYGLAECGWKWREPEGGLLLWAEGPEGVDTRIGSRFHKKCLEHSVIYVPGDLCLAEGEPYNSVRLSFGALAVDKIEEAAKRFCNAAKEVFA